MQATRFDLTIGGNDPRTACDALAARTGLSKSKVKQAMIKGAVWHHRPGAKPRRIRRATTAVRPGERWIFYYDPAILDLQPPPASCLMDYTQYSIWYKPAGLMTQGTRFGDHCALVRQVEHHFESKRKVYLVHRIDREASGLLIVPHSRTAAARISALLRGRKIEKQYLIRVRGDLARYESSGTIDLALDDKSARTTFEALGYDATIDQTLVRVRIHTGRHHQIRRHFAMIGFPVMGDPRYGQNNKNREGLQLVAYALAFVCPFGNGRIEATIDAQKMGLI
ncbi:MAG: RNA pseudouridine synthase [Desulfobacteraceae bacterium]|nr:MAG: RNA pseudouridine synthase [Desulfobacteraceae bacterium]